MYRPKNFTQIRLPPWNRANPARCSLFPPAHAPIPPQTLKSPPNFPLPPLHLLRRRLAASNASGGRRRVFTRRPRQLGWASGLLLAFVLCASSLPRRWLRLPHRLLGSWQRRSAAWSLVPLLLFRSSRTASPRPRQVHLNDLICSCVS